MEPYVRIFDTTLRDGEQTPGVHITVEEKSAIAARLVEMGVDVIEAGFPVSSPGDRDAVARIAREVRGASVAAMARCVAKDIDAAAEALRDAQRPVIHVFLGTSDIHLDRKLRINRADAVRMIREGVQRARATGMTVQFSAEDATRTERPFLRQCVGVAIEAGARCINLPDTVGCVLPNEYAEMIRDMCRFTGPEVVISAHCHNDLGLATANSAAAAAAGSGQIEVTVNGIGERAGNAALEEVAAVLTLKRVARTRIDLAQSTAMSEHVSRVTGVPVQPNRAIVGANAFAHSSGIHQDGILKDPATYEFVSPAQVGAAGHRFVLTSRSGRRAVAHRAERMGYRLSGDELDSVYRAFMREAEAVKSTVPDSTLSALCMQVHGAPDTVGVTEHDAEKNGRVEVYSL